jgi:hypothetical protein
MSELAMSVVAWERASPLPLPRSAQLRTFLFPILPAAISTLPALRAHRRLFAWGSGHLGQFRVETAGGNLDLISEEVNRPQRGAKGDRLNAMAGKAEGERLATGHLGTELVMQAAEN